jgi:hypothetical protein
MATRPKLGATTPAVPDLSQDEVTQYGLDLLEEFGAVEHASETYQDLCLGLETIQIKQVNELLHLLLTARGRG